AASHSSALLANASTEQQEALKEYGLQLGLAFQLVDDMLDYIGDAETMGKNVGDDLAEGKPTLPLIYTMKNGSEEERVLIRKAIRNGDASQLDAICIAVQNSGALDYTKKQADLAYQKACDCLGILPGSVYKEALAGLAKLAVQRDK
ncbi:polyprenyl synthetase family protein, partial [Oleiphilus sp. HI0061]